MAFKMKGFPSHKGTQQHVGTRKGSAVFQKKSPLMMPGHGAPDNHTHEISKTTGDPIVGEWQEGETIEQEGGGTTREDWREVTTPGATVEKIASTPEEIERYEQYLRDVESGKIKRNTKYDESVERETRTVTTEPEQPESKYRTELIRDPGSTAGSRVSGKVSDPSGVMGIKVFGPGLPKGGRYLYHDDARGYSGKSGKFIGSIDELSQYEGLDYDAIMEGSGYGGGGTGDDLEVVKRGGSSTYKKLGGNRTKSWI